MRCGRLVLASVLVLSPAAAAPRPAAYYPAEDTFNTTYSLRDRVIAQVLLIAVGNQNAVPTERFTPNTFNATRDFQGANGLAPSGTIDRMTYDRLFAMAKPMLALWDFREVAHPIRGRRIWMPQGMGLISVPNRDGLTFKDPQDRFQVAYNYYPGVTPEASYANRLDKMRSNGTTIHYAVIKEGWFVISATTAAGVDEYVRYHADGEGILGFVAVWNNARGVVSGERMAVLMSASLGAVMNARPFVEPPNFRDGAVQVATAPTVVPANLPDPGAIPPAPRVVVPAPSPVGPPAARAKPDEDKFSTGSGFFIDDKGHFITNAHVIDTCKTIAVKTPDGQVRRATVTATDAANDMSIVQVQGAQGHRFATLRYGARLGEGIATFGYPHADLLAGTGNFTLGNVTALAGISDDSRFYQISAPVQAGNSGGAMLDVYGNVVGVVSSKLNALKVALASGDFPQNINFAIKGTILASFLESNGLTITPGATTGPKLEPPDLADAAKAVSGFVACQ